MIKRSYFASYVTVLPDSKPLGTYCAAYRTWFRPSPQLILATIRRDIAAQTGAAIVTIAVLSLSRL